MSFFEPMPIERRHQQKKGTLMATDEAVAIFICILYSVYIYIYMHIGRIVKTWSTNGRFYSV